MISTLQTQMLQRVRGLTYRCLGSWTFRDSAAGHQTRVSSSCPPYRHVGSNANSNQCLPRRNLMSEVNTWFGTIGVRLRAGRISCDRLLVLRVRRNTAAALVRIPKNEQSFS